MINKLFIVFFILGCSIKKTIDLKLPCDGFTGMTTLVQAHDCKECGECYVIFDPDSQGYIKLPVRNMIVTCERIE